MDKIAAEAAKKICEAVYRSGGFVPFLNSEATEIIQSALSQHEKAIRAEYEALADGWVNKDCYKYSLSASIHTFKHCAYQVKSLSIAGEDAATEALLKGKAI